MKLSYVELKALVANIVTEQKVSYATFSAASTNAAGLVDKIGLIVTLDSVYQVDKLSFLDGEYMSLGKDIEEWSMDLTLPQDYDATGANTLAPHDPSFRPVFYSKSLGKKVIATTIRNNNFERGVNNKSEYVSIIAMITKKLQDSMAVYRYGLKRELIATFVGLCDDEMDYSSATAVGSITTSTPVGTIMKNSTTNIGILVKKYVSGNKDWATLTASGHIIELDLVTKIAAPVDTSTGEAFIKQLKKDVEVASDLSEGHSLNGNSLGATEGIVLVVKQGVMPEIQVDTLAGAFNKEEVAIPAEVVVVKDFGSETDAYAILMDRRAIRLHNTYRSVKEQLNAEGDFINIFEHTEDTGYISRNAFVKVYKPVA